MKLQAISKYGQSISQRSSSVKGQSTILTVILSGLIFFLFATSASIVFFLLLPLWLVSLVFDRRRIALHLITSRLLYGFMQINPFWHCRFLGLPNLVGQQPAIIVANHQSIVDIVVLSRLPTHFKWVAKSQIFRIPLINCFMLMLGCIYLKPDTISGTKQMINECKRLLKEGVSVLLFPEGTRTNDGKLLPFKDGPFKLAVECNVPIIPVVISGTREIWPKYSKVLTLQGEIQVKILPAVTPQSAKMNFSILRNHVRTLIEQTLNEMRVQHLNELGKAASRLSGKRSS